MVTVSLIVMAQSGSLPFIIIPNFLVQLHGSHVATRKLEMHSKLHGNVVHHGGELLLLVSMLFLLAIPKSLLNLKEFLYTSLYSFAYPKDYGSNRLISALTNTPSLN